MQGQIIYWSVFFDVSKPLTPKYSLRLQIDRSKYMNLIDGIEGKQVELCFDNGQEKMYTIQETSGFNFNHWGDEIHFVICKVKA